MSSLPYAKPTILKQTRHNAGAGSIFINKESAKVDEKKFPEPKNTFQNTARKPFSPFREKKAELELKTNGPISELVYLKSIGFLVLCTFFSIFSLLNIKRKLTTILALITFILTCTNIFFETAYLTRNHVKIHFEFEFSAKIKDLVSLIRTPVNFYTRVAIFLGFLILSLLLILISLMGYFVIECLVLAIISFIISIIVLTIPLIHSKKHSKIFIVEISQKAFKSMKEVFNIIFTQSNRESTNISHSVVSTKLPHQHFIRTDTKIFRPQASDQDQSGELKPYRSFLLSDRPSSSSAESSLASSTASVDELAMKSLDDLRKEYGVTFSNYSQFVLQLKGYLAKTIFKKLVQQIHLNQLHVEQMIRVPTFESLRCREYIMDRIDKLGHTQNLSCHKGNTGEKFRDMEWSTELPSDNQIVLHIISIWISFFMGNRSEDSIENAFKNKYISHSKEPSVGNDRDLLLCITDDGNYYVLTRGQKGVERYWAIPGTDALYSALTIFFFLVGKKLDYLLDGADLRDDTIALDRVFSLH